MSRIVVDSRVNKDGTLQLSLPLGAEEAGKVVRVTIEPINHLERVSPESWKASILSTAGRWQGEFERPTPGELEEREPLS